MVDRLIALKFGVPARFEDRWEGALSSIDIDESWEVTNVTVNRGFLRWSSTVKLPFASVQDWSEDGVALGCTSRAAFAREVPPMAAPARPISAQTPVSLRGATLGGVFVGGNMASAFLIHQGNRQIRIGVDATRFEGKVLHVLGQSENFSAYHTDADVRSEVRTALAVDGALAADDRKALAIEMADGVARLSGNLRTKGASERAGWLAGSVNGVSAVENKIIDDTALEIAIGQALDRNGLQRSVAVFARSSLGVVTLFGYPTSDRAADEVVRAVSGIPGVRRVISRLDSTARTR